MSRLFGKSMENLLYVNLFWYGFNLFTGSPSFDAENKQPNISSFFKPFLFDFQQVIYVSEIVFFFKGGSIIQSERKKVFS